jgi:hypothetical protein
MRGYTYMARAQIPPSAKTGWKTRYVEQIHAVKIQPHRYYKTIWPTQNVKISIMLNNDTNLS